MAKKIDVTVQPDGEVLIDLGGDLDLGCCGCEANQLHQQLAGLGVELKLRGVHCRLPETERAAAKLSGMCRWKIANPLKKDDSLAPLRIIDV